MSISKGVPFAFLAALDPTERARATEALCLMTPPARDTFSVGVALIAHWHFLRSEWEAVVNVVTAETEPSLDLQFLELIARARRGEYDPLIRFSQALRPRLQGAGRADLLAAFEVEASALLMGRGHYLAVLDALEGPVCAPLSGYWAFRAQGVRGISLQALGRFRESDHAIEEQRMFLDSFPCVPQFLIFLRRVLSSLVERERYVEAEHFLARHRSEFAGVGFPFIEALFLQECIRLALATGRLDEARSLFVEQAQVVERGRIPTSYLALVEERCEVALLSGNPNEAFDRIAASIWQSQVNGQSGAQCIAQFVMARALDLSERCSEAVESAEIALLLASKQSFGRDRIRILFLLASLSWRMGRLRDAHAHLEAARRLLDLIPLPVHEALWKATLCLCFGEAHRVAELMSSFAEPSVVRSLPVHFSLYGFSRGSGVVAEVDGESLGAAETLAFLCDTSAPIAVVSHHLLLFPAQHRALSIGGDEAPSRLLRRFVGARRKGLALAEIHAVLWPKVVFRAERHAQACHALLAKVRARLAGSGLGLMRDERSRRYFLATVEGNVPALLRFVEAGAGEAGLSRRAEVVLTALKNRGAMSGSALAQELGVTRQTLQPLLKSLVSRGVLSFSYAGRFSRYALPSTREGSQTGDTGNIDAKGGL